MTANNLRLYNQCCEIPTGVVRVTPEMARHWLAEHNAGNRNLSKHIISKYALTMKRGDWKITHQGLAFDEHRNVLDGQHRLGAIDTSGVAIDIPINTGISRSTFTVLDIGYKRSAAQLIAHPNRKTIAAAARIVGPVTGASGSSHITGGIYDLGADNEQVLAVVDMWPELFDFSKPVTRAYQAKGITAATHLAIIAIASRTRHYGRIGDWFDGLTRGAGLTASDPRLILANRYAEQRQRRMLNSGNGRPASYHIIVKAWNAYVLGRPISMLRYRELEGLPEITS